MKKKFGKNGIKVVCLVMAGTLVCGSGAYAAASNKTAQVVVASSETLTEDAKKEILDAIDTDSLQGGETVYVIMDESGAIQKVVVNTQDENGDTVASTESEKELPVEMKVTYYLDGKEISANDLAGKSGKVTMRFDYTNNQYEEKVVDGKTEKIYVPFVMLTGMMLDSEKFSNVEVTNGKVITENGKMIAIGYAMPGMQDSLGIDEEEISLPDHVEITADVTDFELGTTMTVATNSLFNSVKEEKLDKVDDLKTAVDEMVDGMTKLTDGSSDLYDGLTTLLEKSGELVDGVDQLNDGAAALSAGSKSLADGAGDLTDGISTLTSGAASLQSGARTLANGAGSLASGTADLASGAKTLSEGADTLAQGTGTLASGSSALASGTKELAAGAQNVAAGAGTLAQGTGSLESGAGDLASGITELKNGLSQLAANNEALNGGGAQVFSALLDSASKTLAESGLNVTLTQDNYAEVLGSIGADAVTPLVTEEAKNKVEAQVRANTSAVYAGVESAVRDQVIQNVINVSGAGLSVGDYKAILAGGSDEQKQQIALIALNVESQMASDGVKATITEQTEAQIQGLIAQNMASDAVQGQINAAASQAAESISALKASLDSYASFYTGLTQYTSGVSSALEGSGQLEEGSTKLYEGAKSVNAGAGQLSDGAGQVSAGAQSVNTGAAQVNSGAQSVNAGAGQLSTGAGQLSAGADQVNSGAAAVENGAMELYDGTGSLTDGATKLLAGAEALRNGTFTLKSGAETLADGLAQLKNGCGSLVDGVTQLTDGSGQLKDGLEEFDEKAVQKLASAVNDDLMPVKERLMALLEVSQNYHSFLEDDAENGNVKFIFKTGEIKASEN